MQQSRTLNAWLVQNGEQIPSDPGQPRLLRQSFLARELTSRGHRVTYWTSTFNHHTRAQRTAEQEKSFSGRFGYDLRLLKANAYRRNVSLTRIRSHRQAALAFGRRSAQEDKPDIVVAGYPTIELAHASVVLARSLGVPSIVDVRDQWPDIWQEALPVGLRPLGAPLIAHWRRLQADAVRRCTAVTGITDEFVDWALSSASRERGELDCAFHLAPPAPSSHSGDRQEAAAYWNSVIPQKGPGDVWAVYAGSLSRRTDVLTLLSAAAQITLTSGAALRVIVCGDGDLTRDVGLLAAAHPNLHFMGRRSGSEVSALLDLADLGLIPYRNSTDFLMSYPNKFGELLGKSLPVVSSLEGVTGSMIVSERVGYMYREGDVRSCMDSLMRAVLDPNRRAIGERALGLFHRAFDGRKVYPDFADHVEYVASASQFGASA